MGLAGRLVAELDEYRLQSLISLYDRDLDKGFRTSRPRKMIVLDFIATLIASLIGVYVAFRLGISHERRKKEQDDKERQRQLLTAIKKELQTNLDFLNQLDKGQVSRGAH